MAVKELLVRRMQSFKVEQLFQREVDVLRQLSHPAIPAVLEAFTRHRRKLSGLYAVRELVEGQSLADEMAEREYSPAEAARVGAELLDILAYLHGLQPAVVHRDVTPANVLRREDGTLALIDFGSVKESVLPEGSTVSGTYGYMAPEGLMGRALPASDVYSVGALIVALCAGRSAADLLDARTRLDVGAHIQHRPLARLVRSMLAASPERRPGDPAETPAGRQQTGRTHLEVAYLLVDPRRIVHRARSGACHKRVELDPAGRCEPGEPHTKFSDQS